MKRIVIALAAIAFATSALAADGAALYKSKCAACHGADGKGSKMAPDSIAGKAADVSKKAINEGKGKMKAMKMEAADVDAVSAFVAGLK